MIPYSDSIAAQDAPVAGVRVQALQFATIPVCVGPGGVTAVALLEVLALVVVLVCVAEEPELAALDEAAELPQAPL